MKKMPDLKYSLSKENSKLIQSLIGHELWKFSCSKEDILVSNHIGLYSYSMACSGIGTFIFIKKNLVSRLKICFPIIKEQELTYDLCSIQIEWDLFQKSDFFDYRNRKKYNLEKIQGTNFGDTPQVDKIELYGIENNDFIYEYYDIENKNEYNKIIDIDIDLFFIFYLSNGVMFKLSDNTSTGGCIVNFGNEKYFQKHLESLQIDSNYEEFNLTLKKTFV